MTSNFPQWQVNLFSWGLAGAFITAGYPLDFVRSRMQVMPELIERGLLHKNYTGMLDCLRRVHLEEGLKAFWKGNGSNLVRLLPNESCVFYLKELLQRTFQLDPQMKASAFVLLNSAIGITAGWIVAIAFYPIEFTRQQLTNRVERTGLGMHHHFKETIRSNGVRGLYKGVHLFLMGSVVFRGTYFGIYDSVKINAQSEEMRWLMSYISICAASYLTYPIDTVRRRMVSSQRKYKGMRHCFQQIRKKDGIRGVFSGWQMIWLQALTGGTFFYIYDRIFTSLKIGQA